LVAGCGGDGREAAEAAGEAGGEAEASGLTSAQLAKGIGPVESVTLAPAIDEQLAAQGKEVFAVKCSACHKLEARYVAPQLGGVLERRTPEFVLNMILNPAEMVAKHPETKKLFAEFLLQMPNQNLTEPEARAVLEYIRSWRPE